MMKSGPRQSAGGEAPSASSRSPAISPSRPARHRQRRGDRQPKRPPWTIGRHNGAKAANIAAGGMRIVGGDIGPGAIHGQPGQRRVAVADLDGGDRFIPAQNPAIEQDGVPLERRAGAWRVERGGRIGPPAATVGTGRCGSGSRRRRDGSGPVPLPADAPFRFEAGLIGAKEGQVVAAWQQLADRGVVGMVNVDRRHPDDVVAGGAGARA